MENKTKNVTKINMEIVRNKVCSLVKNAVDDKTYDIDSKWSENYLILFNEKQSEINDEVTNMNNDCGQIGFVVLEKRYDINQQLLFKNSRKFSDFWKFENGFIFFKNVDILLKLCEGNYDPIVAVCKFFPKFVKKLHFPTIGSIKTPIICDEIQDSIAATHGINEDVFQLLPLKKQAIFSQTYYCPNITRGKEITFKTYAVINFIQRIKVVPPRPLVQTNKTVQADLQASPIININGTNLSGIKVYVATAKPKNPTGTNGSTTQINGHAAIPPNILEISEQQGQQSVAAIVHKVPVTLSQNSSLNINSISATSTNEQATPLNNSLPAQVVINIDSDSDIPDDYEETSENAAPFQFNTSSAVVPTISLQQIVKTVAKSPVQKVPAQNITTFKFTGMENNGVSSQLVSPKQISNINSSSSTSFCQNIIDSGNMLTTNTSTKPHMSTNIQPIQHTMPSPNIILQPVMSMQRFPQQIAVPNNCLLNYGNFNTKSLNTMKTNSYSAMKKVQTSHFAQNIQEINYCNTTVINMWGNNVPFHLPTFNSGSGMVVQKPFPHHVPFQNYPNHPHMFKQRVKHRPPVFHPYRFPTLQTINPQQRYQMLPVCLNVPTPIIENQPPKSLSPPKTVVAENQSNDQMEPDDDDCMIIDEDEFSDKNEAVDDDSQNRLEIISDKDDVLPQTELDCFLKENPDVEMLVENCSADPNDIFYGFSDETSESTLEKDIQDLENVNICETAVAKPSFSSDKDTGSAATATNVTANSSRTLTSEETSSIGYSNILQDKKEEATEETQKHEESISVDENNNTTSQENVESTEATQVGGDSNARSSELSLSPKISDMNFDRAFSKRYVSKTSTPSKTVETCPVDIYLERRSLRPCQSKCCDDGNKRTQSTVEIKLCKSIEIQKHNSKSNKSKTKDKMKKKTPPKKKSTKKDKNKQTDIVLKGTSPSTFYKNKVVKNKFKKGKKKGITVNLNNVELNKALDNMDENGKTLVSPPRFMEDMSFASLLATPETPHSRIVTPKKLVPKLKLKKTSAAKSKKKKKAKASKLKTSVKELQSEEVSHAVAITSTPQSVSSASCLSSTSTLKPIDFHGRPLIQSKKVQPRIIFHTSSTTKTDPRNKDLPVPGILRCKWKSEMKTSSPDILVEAKWDAEETEGNIREHTKPSSEEDSPKMKIIIPTKYKKTTSIQKTITPKKQTEQSAGPSTGNPNSRVNFLFLENRNVVSTPPISVIFSDADAVMDSIPLGLSPAYFRDYENDLNANYKGVSKLTCADEQQQNQSLALSDDPEPLQTFPTNIDWGKQQSKISEILAVKKGSTVKTKRKEALMKILNKQTENLTITHEKEPKRNKLPSCERIIQTLKETKLQHVRSASKEATPTKSNLKHKKSSDKSGKGVSFVNRLCFPTASEDVANKCLNENSGHQTACDNCPYDICDKSSVKANSIALCDRQSCKTLSPNLFRLLNALHETVLEETSTPYADEFCLKFLLLKFGYGSVFASFEVIQEKLKSLRKFFEASPHSCKLKLVVTGHEELLCLLRKLACSNYSIQKMWHCVRNKLSLIQVFVELNKISTKARYLHKNLLKIDGFSNLTSCPLALEKLAMTLEQLKSKGDGNTQNRMERLRMDYESLTMVYAFKHFEIETQITKESEAIYKLLTCEQKIFINEFLRGMSRSCDVVLM